MNDVILKDETEIENMIYEVRGKQVMLDSDLAKLYQCKNGTKEINQAIKNNINKFPLRFAFRITEEEFNNLKSKILTSKTRGGSRKGHTVFTEQGVAMLATILKTDVATDISIKIMDAFVTMRNYITDGLLTNHVEHKLLDHDNRIKILEGTFEDFKEKNNHIFFEGQIYDAYSKILDIFDDAKKEIIIIDNYLDKNMLDTISKSRVKVTLVTADKLDNIDLTKYRSQYDNLDVVINKSFHDRFIILDKNIVYHLGASLNTLGKKCFAITKMEDEDILNQLLNKI